MKTTNTQIDQITAFLKGLCSEIYVLDYVTIEDIDFEDAYNSIYEMIDNNNGFNVDIIYYSNAIAYLKDNDASLMESLEIAAEYGFELKNLNSEVLASLLASRNAIEEFAGKQDEIEEFFNSLEDSE